jgi:phage anti-repressor protein
MSISLPISSGTIGNLTQLTVDARALHCALEVKRDFSTWIKARVTKYGFVEGEDYEKSSMITDSPIRGSQAAIEYRLSVNMGKELAMVENNERGRMVRRYFIECERRLMENPAPSIPSLSTVADRRPLNILVHAWAQKSDQKYSMCWKQVNSAFGLAKAAEFPAHWIPDAVAWVQEKIDALPEKKALPHPSHLLDLTLDTPIGYRELLDALASLTWRMEKTCQCELDAEFEKGRRLFSKATGKESRLDFMLAASLVGPKHATLEMLKSAQRIAETAYKTHFLVCEAGK